MAKIKLPQTTGLLKRLDKGPVLCAEGYLFELEQRGFLKAGAYVPEAVLLFPEEVTGLHNEFVRCGSDVVEAFTYYGHRAKMKAIGKEDLLEDLNRQAVRLARQIAKDSSKLLPERPLVAGNVSNTWEYDHLNHEKTSKIVRSMFAEQIKWAVEEGVDFVIGETFNHLGEAMIALEEIKKYNLPAVITFATTRDKTYDDLSWSEACRQLESAGADVVGLNCSRGPATMMKFLKTIRKAVKCHVAALPVPYRTNNQQPTFMRLKDDKGRKLNYTELDPKLLTRYEMADFATQASKMGINYIGICCGAGPHHVRAMAEALGRTVPASEFSPDLSEHPALGKKARTNKSQYAKDWEVK